MSAASGAPSAQQLYAAGRLDAAITQLGAELRTSPLDARRRAFLFELLAFAGQYDRAAKQLDALAGNGPTAEVGTKLYRMALECERVREHMFATGDFPMGAPPASPGGTLNGRPFARIADADPRIGARLELFAGGHYLWLPFAHLAAVRLDAPERLRDVRWPPARVATNASVRDLELGEVLLPALTPAAWRHPDPEIQLGRATDWEDLPDDGPWAGEFAPVGQKMLRVDDDLVPLIEVRELVLNTTEAVA